MSSLKTKLIEWYSPLPSWAKGVLVVGGAGVVIFTGFSIVSSINSAKRRREQQAKVNGYIDDLNNLQQNGIRPSYSQSQFNQWADALQEQFSACDFSVAGPGCGSIGFSDSGRTVRNIAAVLKNDADFLALQAAFGTRTIDKWPLCGGDIKDATLSMAMANMLTTGEIYCINNILKEIKINYQF